MTKSRIKAFFSKNSTLAAIVIFLVSVTTIIANLGTIRRDFLPKSGNLIVADIISDCYNADQTCKLDFRVINKGEAVVVINRVVLEALGIQYDARLNNLESSGQYNVDISKIGRRGDRVVFAVAHEVPADDADRFTVTLTAKNMADEFRSWKFRVTLETSDGRIDGGVIPRDNDPDSRLILPFNPSVDSMAPWLRPVPLNE